MSTSPWLPLGIDISKASFDVALLSDAKRPQRAHFENSQSGYTALQQWLQAPAVERVYACLEANNIYGHGLAAFLYEQGYRVSIVNPAQMKGFGQSKLTRTKTDAADARLITRYCQESLPPLWQPAPPEVAKLQALSRRLAALEKMMTQEKNRLQLCDEPELQSDIEAHLAFLPERAQQLLTTIPGIGSATAIRRLAEVGPVNRFDSARQLAAFAGLTPQAFQSGTSLRGKSRLCKIGNPRLRQALFFPALTVITSCPRISGVTPTLVRARLE